MVIQHNLAAATTERQLGIVEKNKSLAIEHLATGYKIAGTWFSISPDTSRKK